MKNILFYFLAIQVFTANLSCNAQQSINNLSKEGKIRYNWTRYYANPADDVKDYTFQIWYLDSAIILEYVQVEFDMGIPPEKRDPAKLKTKKFVYLNLKNFSCQDYGKFDTAAVPKSNYKLGANEILQWNFYTLDSFSTYSKLPKEMSDTIIDKEKYKRKVFEEDLGSDTLTRIVYLTKNYSDNLFHISRSLDNKYIPYRVVRYDDYLEGKPFATLYYEQLNKKLTSLEKEVFRKWAFNATHTVLPVLTSKQVFEAD